ncbi:MAG TPA: hypothetical protein VE967_17895 [Gemmatimonadaceae bacterium]|nr:hypothetical protein [Gemmatimonadaceae bacterium]
MRFHRIVPASALIAAFACGGGDQATEIDGLTSTEVSAVVESLTEVGAFSFDLGLVAPSVRPGVAALTTRFVQVDRVLPCAGGGAVHIVGEFESYISGPDVAYDIDLTETHDGCRGTVHNGRQFTFSGSPSARMRMQYSQNTNTRVTRMHGSFAGTFNWTDIDGASGACTADLTLSSNHQSFTLIDKIDIGVTGQITGTICSRKVDVHY